MSRFFCRFMSVVISAGLLINVASAQSALYDSYVGYVKSNCPNDYRSWYAAEPDTLEYLLLFMTENDMITDGKITAEIVERVNGMYEPCKSGALTPAGLTNIAETTITGITNKAYTGKAVTQTPKITDKGNTLKKDKDYILKYNRNTKAGTATLSIIGKGDYYGITTRDFKITAEKTPLIKSIKMNGAYPQITWERIKDADGYQLLYSINGGGYKLYQNINNSNTVRLQGSKPLTKENKYDFRIRAYKAENNKKIYGKASNPYRLIIDN